MIGCVRKKSMVHALGARAKLALLALFMLAQVFAPLAYAPLFLAATLALYSLARMDFLEVVKSRKALLLLPLIPSLVRLLFEKGSVEIAGALLPAGLVNGSLNFVFLLSLVYTPLLFALTTAPSQISGALRSCGMPKRWALIFSIAFVSVSYIQKKAERTLAAQRARGCRRSVPALMLPVLHSCFRRARTMAYSMAARGFDADEA
ncbi:MAG: energy-coupling factor transporter transmembrane component T [Candidatus Micrarchaeia archaeon]|jgi:energy-coupling factor transporter transmembrane protein EcfT